MIFIEKLENIWGINTPHVHTPPITNIPQDIKTMNLFFFVINNVTDLFWGLTVLWI